MTVGELIEELRKYPPLKPVRISIDDVGDDCATTVECHIDAVVYEGSHVALQG